jgi:hypothetical protein
MGRITLTLPFVLLLGELACAVDTPDGGTRTLYLRPTAAAFTRECTFTIHREAASWKISSVTGRGQNQLTVEASYDKDNHLREASASLMEKETVRVGQVKVHDEKAAVQREGQPPQTFDVPPNVIVTSAPDWSDVFLMCQRYDQKKAGKQEFAALWIHPVQPAQRLTFSAEKAGSDTIEHDGKKVELVKLTLRIRGNSAYAAWADEAGRMIKLVPLPYKAEAKNWLVLEGYEKSTAELKPGE